METFRRIMQAAVETGASDVYLKPGAPLIFRVKRELINVEGTEITAEWVNSILQSIVPADRRQNLANDREVDMAVSLEGIGRFRANVFQQRGQYVITLRVVKLEAKSFQDLHLPEIVRRLAEGRRGILLICGAPGAGKSTTLAAILNHLNTTVRRHIITLEDPIEFVFEDKLSVIDQREVGLDTASFETGLRNVLRQDPDVLVIGEMRDTSSVRAAVAAANVGTLVISTLHTGDAARSVQRALELFPNEEREHARRQLAGTLHGVICQKLARTASGELVPAVEVLINTGSVRKLIEEDRLEKIPGTIEMGAGDGMQTFEQSLLQLISAGTITQQEAYIHAPNPESLKMKLQGVFLTETRRILKARD